jgi:hypothetical protein
MFYKLKFGELIEIILIRNSCKIKILMNNIV